MINRMAKTPGLMVFIYFITLSIFENAFATIDVELTECHMHKLQADVELIIIGHLTEQKDFNALRLASKREYKLIMKRRNITTLVSIINSEILNEFVISLERFFPKRKIYKRSQSLSSLTTVKLEGVKQGTQSDCVEGKVKQNRFRKSSLTNPKKKSEVEREHDTAPYSIPSSFSDIPKPFRQILFKGIKIDKKLINLVSRVPGLQKLIFTEITKLDDFSQELKKLKKVIELEIIETPITNKQLKSLGDNSKLKAIALKNNSLKKKHLDTLSQFTQLTILRIAQNKLQGDLLFLAGIKNLTLLTLSGCDLVDEDLKTLNVLNSLTILCLNNNQRITLAGLVTIFLRLKTLYASNTGIESKNIPSLISHFSELKTLKLGHMKINPVDLSEALSLRHNLEILKDLCT